MNDNGKIDISGQMKDIFIKSSDLIPTSPTSNEVLDEENETREKNIIANNIDAHQEITNSEVAEKCEPHKDANEVEVIKPTKRTRVRNNSKSIIQSAIARKEESFNTYERPKRKRNQRKKATIAIDKKLEEPESPSKKSILPRKTKSSPRATSKSIYVELESSEDSLETENNIRKSSRALFSSRKSSATVSKSEELITKAQILSRLCKCSENKQLYMESDSDTQFCTAVDSLREKLVGCSRLVEIRKVPMYRPSTRVPFGVYCESHKQRLIRHNCCPTCGVFCTEGSFSECPSKHHFHKDCKLSIENQDYCPHCGDSGPSTDVIITMHTSKKPVFLSVQRSQHTSARMTFKEIKEDSSYISQTVENLIIPIIDLDEIEYLKSRENEEIDFSKGTLIEAIENNDVGKVAIILENGSSNTKHRLPEYSNGTLLHLAALKGNIQIAYLLILNHIDIDALNSEQNSALMIAIVERKNDWVQYLVQSGADLTLKGIDGMNCLHVAAKSGNLEACKVILDSSNSYTNFVNFQDDGGWTPLVWACEHGFCDIVKYLVSSGADISIRDVQHNVALHWAAFKGSSQVVELLLNLKADINVQNVHGDTPLHISARDDHYNCVIILLSRKANVSTINKNNETPLDCVAKDGLCFTPLTLAMEFNLKKKSEVGGLLVNDISRGREMNPIQCYNNVDDEKEPKQYTYIKKNCQSSDSFQIDTKLSAIKSCTCVNRCKSTECNCAKLSLKCWYDQGKLVQDFNFSDSPLIFECNDLCACNAILCSNRLVQKPLTERFELYKTMTKGWAIKSLNFIGMGNYVCEYIGEILTDMEAEQREDDTYLFDLDNREIDSFCIDAKHYGNFARFINHSCEPNLQPIKVFVEHHDLRFPRIAFFAKKNIEAMEELSFDYGDKFWLVKYKSFTCECETSSCKYSKETIGATLEKHHMRC